MTRYAIVWMLSCWLPAFAGAQQPMLDRVVVRSTSPKNLDAWSQEPPRVVEGGIREFNAQSLVIVADGKPAQFESDRIQSIKVNWTRQATKDALLLFEQRKYQEAVRALDAARAGLPQWQQQLLVAKIVQAADAAGNPRVAGILFLKLAESLPPPVLYADMPLCWTVCEPDQALAKQAEEWLASDSEAANLMGASWLLFSTQAEEARRKLVQLQASKTEVIAQLAVAQSWRSTSPPDTMKQLPEWLDFRDRLLLPLQLGPTEFLADRLMRVGYSDLAIGQWMRIATNHSDIYHRARTAMDNAAETLKRLGRNDEADRLRAWIDELDGK